jgi:hypothetical protein
MYMRKLMLAFALLGIVACDPVDILLGPYDEVEEFENTMSADYSFGYENDDMAFDHFYNKEYGYWGGFVQSRVKDMNAANGLFANQYAVYNSAAYSGDSFLLYYYDAYNEPCDIRMKTKGMRLTSVRLNLTTYTYASITNEDINDFARVFTDGDYLKVVFTSMRNGQEKRRVECYVVDFRNGKRDMATDWRKYDLSDLRLGEEYDRVRVTIETSDVGEWGANTPLYIAMDDLTYQIL